jgi:hypothetical protein
MTDHPIDLQIKEPSQTGAAGNRGERQDSQKLAARPSGGSARSLVSAETKLVGRLVGGVLALSLLVPSFAFGATNLVPNPGFDAGIAGWTPNVWFKANIGASPLDQDGDAASGSLRVFDLDPSSWQGNLTSDCFPVQAGESVVFGASAFTPGVPKVHTVAAAITFYSDPGCALGTPGHANADLKTNYGASTWRPTQGYTQVPAAAQAARLTLVFAIASSEQPDEVYIDNAYVYEGSTCASTAGVVCLNQDRFRVDVYWYAPTVGRGFGTIRDFATGGGDSAHAWFFAPSNVELVVKVLDGCAYNDRFWVFAAGLTDVRVDLRVKDTHSGESWLYENPPGHPFPPVQDTNAFTSCP